MTDTMTDTNIDPEFSSTDIELFAVIWALTNREPAVSRDQASGYGYFTTDYNDQVQSIINAYSSGKLLVNARDLLMARRRLFRAVKALPGVKAATGTRG